MSKNAIELDSSDARGATSALRMLAIELNSRGAIPYTGMSPRGKLTSLPHTALHWHSPKQMSSSAIDRFTVRHGRRMVWDAFAVQRPDQIINNGCNLPGHE